MSTIRSHDVSLHSSRDSHDVTMNIINPHDHVMNIVKGIPFWNSQWQEVTKTRKMAGSFPTHKEQLTRGNSRMVGQANANSIPDP